MKNKIDIATIGTKLEIMLFPIRDRYCFGGSGLKNSHAKTIRPLNSKSALHVVMRSKYAIGSRNFKRHESVIKKTAFKLAKKSGIKIYTVHISAQNIQFLLRFSSRKQIQSFLRGFAGLVARKCLRAERGSARKYDTAFAKFEDGSLDPLKGAIVVKKGERFWDQRPFSRVLSWGPQFAKAKTVLSNKSSSVLAFGFLKKREIDALGFEQLYSRILSDLRVTFGFA